MHSHERTLLAKLGFADPDRKSDLHDVACRYLATPMVREKLLGISGVLQFEHEPSSWSYGCEEERSVESAVLNKHNATLELEIGKGEGQYRTTIGFVDVLITAEILHRHVEVQRREKASRYNRDSEWGEWKPHGNYVTSSRACCCIEAKIGKTSVGDLLRQLNLYRRYLLSETIFIVATYYELTAAEIDALEAAGIRHVLLGKAFRNYVAREESATPVENVEI